MSVTSSPISLCAVPPVLKPIAHFLKAATEHANRDPVITYWCRLAALQTGLTLDKKSKEALELLLPLMDWLEKEKKVLKEQEAVTSEVVASAHVENYANKLFFWADKEDRAARFGKNVVKSFYTAGILFDVLSSCFELSPENAHARKYAKWKAAHIHTCLKNGQTPTAGPVGGMDDEEEEEGAAGGAGGWAQPQIPPPAATASHHAPPPPHAAAPPALPPQEPSYQQPPPAPVPAPRAVNPPTVSVPALAEGLQDITLTPEITKAAQKYCKYAASALDYDDRNTALLNMTKAINLLKTGRES